MKYRLTGLIVFICLLSSLCLGRPPKVIKMIPENGAVDVKPGPCKIRILFDQDMSSNGYSICGQLEVTGKPKWSGKRAFVMNVNLKPDHDYEFGVNCPSAQNFKSIRGESAEILFVKFHTAGGSRDNNANQLTLQQNRAAIDALKNAIVNFYSYREFKKLDWNTLFREHQEQMLNATSPEKFVFVASKILSEAKDKHIWFKIGNKQVHPYIHPFAPNVDLEVTDRIIGNVKKQSNIIYSGQLDNGIGYIRINSWSSSQEKALDGFFVALNELSEAPGLIIDVRCNGGGSEPLARQVAGCFIDKPKLYAKNISIDPQNPGQFTQIHERYVEPNKSRPQYRGKVAVLIGPVVMSSCEAFVLMMKQVPGCVLVGEPTQGSSGNPKPYDLGNGVTVFLPSWQAMLPDGTCFEGKGIQPDILVKTTPTQLTSKDPVLEAAQQMFTKK